MTYTGLETTNQVGGQGILVQANGGAGGPGAAAGGIVGQAGGGGLAGAGGSATLTLGDTAITGSVRTSGNFAHGAVVQSVGGGGGNGGRATFNAEGGAGAAGGNGGLVSLQAPTPGSSPPARTPSRWRRKSVGGGGGVGGDTNDIAFGITQVAIRGNGGLGGNGHVNLNLTRGVFASTEQLGRRGHPGPEHGGSGRSRSSAPREALASLRWQSAAMRGVAGTGGPVTVVNKSLITSYGDHASGIQAQSIGGGGGKGGAGFVIGPL